MSYRFKGRAALADDTGYYYTRWDRATDVEVVAETKQEANKKAFALLGPSNRNGWSWNIKWETINETV